MSEEELIIASNKINTYTYSYIDLQNSKTILLEDDYKNIIESAYNNIKYEKSSFIDNNKVFFGLLGLDEFIKDSKILKETCPSEEFYAILADNFGNVSIGYYQLFNILKGSIALSPYKEELEIQCNLVYEIAQEWTIIANMCLKGKIKENTETSSRIDKKLTVIYQLTEQFRESVLNNG